jgi:AraC-like DNA-binding protein
MASQLDPHMDRIHDLTNQGWSSGQIAAEFGCSSSVVQRAMKAHGIPANPAGPRKGSKMDRRSRLDPHTDQIREWTESGWRIGRIASELGMSKQAVWDAMDRNGIPRHPKHSCPGDVNPAWKGGRFLDDDGYVLLYQPDHPHADSNRRVREHRVVMESVIGRHLLPREVVDHIDGDPANNDPANLRLFASNAEHLRETLSNQPKRSRNPLKVSRRSTTHQAIGTDVQA